MLFVLPRVMGWLDCLFVGNSGQAWPGLARPHYLFHVALAGPHAMTTTVASEGKRSRHVELVELVRLSWLIGWLVGLVD